MASKALEAAIMEIGSNPSSEFSVGPPDLGFPQPAMASVDRFAHLRSIGRIGLAVLLYGVLADGAVETFLSGAGVRWRIVTRVVVYAVATVLLWRR